LANVFENKKVQTAADKAVVSDFLRTQLKKSKEAEFAQEGRKRARARATKTLARDEAAKINAHPERFTILPPSVPGCEDIAAAAAAQPINLAQGDTADEPIEL
jgi:hypothetical protein